MEKGIVHSICIGSERGKLKKEVKEARVNLQGIENDGHSGDWGRQVTCLNRASLLKANKEHNLQVGPGGFAENILIDGLDFKKITEGSRLQMGPDNVVIEVTQIGKEDHPSIVTRTLGVSLLPYEGLFCRVIKGGILSKGDAVEMLMLP